MSQLRIKLVSMFVLLLALLVVFWWLFVGTTSPSSASSVRLTFVGFTNGVTADPVALFTLTNSGPTPILYSTMVLVQTTGNNGFMSFPPDKRTYERWAGNPPEKPASVLAPGAAMTFGTELPKSGGAWIEHMIWQSKPSKSDYTYAAVLDNLLKLLHKQSYPSGMVPPARIWREVQITSEMLNERLEPGAATNGGDAAWTAKSEVIEGRHR